ncbi:unnamed protein product [Linum tenue]|uniref:Uncharacterized protein n=1 Tax=Linum tenue TaxID=586396 RepID=A0AAV0HZD4_9ROSI|nr:unnamed protein product [Linum tenue]
MSRAGGQPRIFAMRREEANAAPEVVTGSRGINQVKGPNLHVITS